MTLKPSTRTVLGLIAASILVAALAVNHVLSQCAAGNGVFRLYPWGCEPLPRIHLERGLQRT